MADILDALPALVRHTRRSRQESFRAAAAKIGIDHSTLSRLEAGSTVHSSLIPKVLRWLDGNPA